MTGSDWDRLQELFAQLIELPDGERDAFLDAACGEHGDNEELRRQLEAMVHADTNSGDRTSAIFDVHDIVDGDRALENQVIDAWRLGKRIGVGGMGSVFLATRADGSFEQTVALKVVKKGMDTENVVRRFRNERQILAKLEHPNIARVIDGGVTEDGRPYFVMEYVDGVPITEYCDQNRLTVQQRLELFRKVCNAVHYAHQGLVVHRDLKPSNILVTAEGIPKLLDFGIAKLLDEPDDLHLTRTGMQLLTPAYASPEQLRNESATTQTDVYTLGVILYELLSGRRPFEVQRSAAELRQLILAGDPIRPSTALTQQPLSEDKNDASTTVEKVSEARGMRAERLRKSLQGDLDTICLMALRSDPSMRYASVDQMAADIARHIGGLPVIARPDSLGYRLGKFVRRNRAGVIGATIAIITFLTTVSFYTVRLAEERDFALSEQQKANEVVRFVTGLFEVSDPSESRGEEVSARQLLDEGALQIRNELANRPGVQATMMRVLGEVYYSLGAIEQGESLISEALEKQRSLYGEHNLDVATSKIVLGFFYQDRGEIDVADRLYREALQTRQDILGYEHRDVMEAISVRAFLEESAGNYAEAEALHKEALALARRLYPGDHADVAKAMTKLAGLYRLQDRAAEAEPLLRDSLAMQERVFGGDHPDSADTKRQLAGLLRDTRRFEESQALYLDVIESRTKMLGPDHVELAHTWNSYSQLLSDMGDIDGAVEANRNFIDIMERIADGPHPSFGAAYNNLALLYQDQGDLDSAMRYFRLSIDMQDAIDLPPRHVNRSFPMAGVGGVYLRQQRFAEAAAIFRDMLELRRENLPEEHRLVSELKNSLGAALIGLQEYTEAETLLLDAYQRLLGDRGPDDPRTKYSARLLADLYDGTGDSEQAARYRELGANDP